MTRDRSSLVEELCEAYIEQSLDHALLLLDLDAKIVWASAGAERIFGCPAESLVGVPLSAHFLPDDAERGIDWHELEVARSNGSGEDDRWTLRADGSRFWATGLTYALRGRDGEQIGYAKLLRNRTDWKQQLEAFKNQAAAASKQNASKNRMISVLAHELRNPLAPLLNAARMLREGVPWQYPVQLIERQVDFIRRLVDDLLETTRVREGKVQLHKERVVLHQVVARAVETVQPLVARQAQTLDVLLPSGPICLEADAVRLQQVLTNLLTNAAKYTPRSGRIWLKATVEGNEAVVRVRDNGAGIAPHMLSHIFDLFVQVETRPAAEDGVGIGLSLVKDLVELHGGTVQANSDGIDKGSEFTVRLPTGAGSQQ